MAQQPDSGVDLGDAKGREALWQLAASDASTALEADPRFQLERLLARWEGSLRNGDWSAHLALYDDSFRKRWATAGSRWTERRRRLEGLDLAVVRQSIEELDNDRTPESRRVRFQYRVGATAPRTLELVVRAEDNRLLILDERRPASSP